MAQQLQIAGALDQVLLNRIKNNLNNQDSLKKISGDLYLKMLNYLEEFNDTRKLGYISTGAFVESFYLSTHSIKKYYEKDIKIRRLVDQKIVLENLLDNLKSYNNKDLQPVLSLLGNLSTVFGQFEKKPENKTSIKKEGARLLIGGGSETILTEEQFIRLKKEITEIRTKIITGNL